MPQIDGPKSIPAVAFNMEIIDKQGYITAIKSRGFRMLSRQAVDVHMIAMYNAGHRYVHSKEEECSIK